MGLPHALLKVDKPEVFDLGKGNASQSWGPVFERYLGPPFDHRQGNFLQPMHNLDVDKLVPRLEVFDAGYTGNPEIVAARILKWMGDDVCVLCNGWEEMQQYIDDSNVEVQTEFRDTAAAVNIPLLQYRETGSVWED